MHMVNSNPYASLLRTIYIQICEFTSDTACKQQEQEYEVFY